MATGLIRNLISEDKNPLEKHKDPFGQNIQVYKYKHYTASDKDWERNVRIVKEAIQAEKNWENATQLIKKLIYDKTDPLEQKPGENGRPSVYKHKQYLVFETDWERAVESVEAESPLRRTLDTTRAIKMTPAEIEKWKLRNGWEQGKEGGGRHSRRHPRRHRGSRSGSSRMRSKGKRTYKKRNMRH